jgi:hypothetical protein
MGSVQSIDETYIRTWLSDMKPGFFIKSLSPDVKKIFHTYINTPTENLERLAYRLFKIRNKHKEICAEFAPLFTQGRFNKIPELDTEFETEQKTTAAQPAPPVPVNVAPPVVPKKAIVNFPFTAEWIFGAITSSFPDYSTDTKEHRTASFNLFNANGIVDIDTIKEEFLKFNIIYNSGIEAELAKNYTKALGLLHTAMLRTKFDELFKRPLTEISAFPDFILESFKQYEAKLLESGILFGEFPYIKELNAKILNNINAVNELDKFFDTDFHHNVLAAKDLFCETKDLSNLYVRTIANELKGKSDGEFPFKLRDTWSRIGNSLAIVQKKYKTFNPDISELTRLEKIIEEVFAKKLKLDNIKIGTVNGNAISYINEIYQSTAYYAVFNAFAGSSNNSNNEPFYKILDALFKNITSRHTEEIVSIWLPVEGNKIVTQDGYYSTPRLDTGITPDDFSEKSLELIIKYPDTDFSVKATVLNKNHEDVAKKIGANLNISDEDVKAEYKKYKDFISKLNFTDEQKITVASYNFLSRTYLNSKMNSFYFEMLKDLDPMLKIEDGRGIYFKLHTNPRDFFNFLISLDKEKTIDIIKSIAVNPNSLFLKTFSKESFKGLKREEKSAAIECFTDMFFDHMGANPGLIDTVFKSLEPYQQSHITSKIASFHLLKSSFGQSKISFMDNLTSRRIREILSYNDVQLQEVKLPRKSKFDTFTSYNKKIEDHVKTANIIPEPKITENTITKEHLDEKTYNYIKSYHAGKHGNIYPLFKRSFSVHLPQEQYEEFTKRMANDGANNEIINPAFHGTGGIGASMILRFGFRVINDPNLTTGKMLGNGVYFSNKIDKSAQYVGNSGLTRKRGTKGYIFEMEAQLGLRNKNYSAAGIDKSDNIRSPEWCVYEPNHQLKIMTAYEVELGNYDDYVALKPSGELGEGVMSFKQFLLTEKEKEKPEEQIRFVFFDNQVVLNDRTIHEANKIEAYGNDIRIERTVDGTAVIFLYTNTTESYDIAFTGKIKPAVLKKYLTLLNTRKLNSGLRIKPNKRK